MRDACIGVMLLVALAPCGVWAQSETAAAPEVTYKLDTVVAKVNDHLITHDQLCERMFRLYGQQAVGQMINELLIEDAARAQSIEVSDKDLDARYAEFKGGFATDADLEGWLRAQGMREGDLRAQLRLGMLQERVVVKARTLTVTQSEVEEFFTQNKDRLGTPEQLRLSHIVVPTEDEANEVVIALESGADFAKLAARKSRDSATKDKGGDIGYVAAGALAPQLQEAIASLEVGATTGVIATDAGFHVMKLMEKKPAVPAVLDKKLKDELTRGLLKAKVDAALPEVMRELAASAVISISGVAATP